MANIDPNYRFTKRVDPVDLFKRLRVLKQKLEYEGESVPADTVHRAIQFVLERLGDDVAAIYREEYWQ